MDGLSGKGSYPPSECSSSYIEVVDSNSKNTGEYNTYDSIREIDTISGPGEFGSDVTIVPGTAQEPDSIIDGPLQISLFEDFIYWAQRPEAFSNQTSHDHSDKHTFTAVLLHLICAEWLTMSDYITTRLTQIDWELGHTSGIITTGSTSSQGKLSAWRGAIPLYREMISEAMHHIMKKSKFTRSRVSKLRDTSRHRKKPMHRSRTKHTDGVSEYQEDFELVLGQMEEHQWKLDKLTDVAAAAISIEESRRSIELNKDLQTLTYLATFIMPMSFIATLMSMQADVSELGATFVLWGKIALPVGLAIMVLTLSQRCFRNFVHRKARHVMPSRYFYFYA
jgi:Mg2+ and Co2+ transporter CorA